MNAEAENAPRAGLERLSIADYALDAATLDRLMSPALVVYRDKVERNLARMLAYMGGDAERWRPHLKTTKIPAVYAMLLDAGLRAFKCATVREARCLLEVVSAREIGDVDLIVAYPLLGPALAEADTLASANPSAALSVLSEDPAHAASVPAALGVYVDVNPGMDRTGIPCADSARILSVADAAGDRFRGVHFYDGHIHDAEASVRRSAAHAVYRRLADLLVRLDREGVRIDEVVTSGTPTFRYALDFPGFYDGQLPVGAGRHRVSPGTVVFHDMQYDELLDDLELEPAAVVLARVVSRPGPAIATCDAGSKSLASEYGDPIAFAIGRPGLVARTPSEEHLPFSLDGAAPVELGEALYLVPRHICPTVNLAEEALLVHPDHTSEVVAVAGRAHDLMRGPV